MDDPDRYIGHNVATIRVRRGWSQQQLADKTIVDGKAISRSALANYESGDRIVDSRKLLYALATALQVSLAELTGHAEDRHLSAASAFHLAAPRIEAALMSAGQSDDDHEPAAVDLLARDANRAMDLRMAGDLSSLGAILPTLITDCYRRTTLGAAVEREAAWAALSRAAFATGLASKGLGLVSLSWNAARVTAEAALACGDRVALAASEFVSSQVLLAMPGSVTASLGRAQSAIDSLEGDLTGSPEGMQLYGMLHLQASLASAATGHESAGHLDEARDMATRTAAVGDAFRLDFGRPNVDIWGMSVALEEGRGSDAIEIAATVDHEQIATAERRARYFIELARGYSQEGEYPQAMAALLNAESIAPQYVRSRSIVRELSGYMLRKAKRELGTGELARFAERVGALESHGLTSSRL
ncbi:helix-turn-helix domain-containing protein [Nocardia sp. A7]|uniref:helix-turn-helix domain-containing protein n=1 Tax=Nocardia sp. A7 TaxID=2789274 RepID=UPI00397845B3